MAESTKEPDTDILGVKTVAKIADKAVDSILSGLGEFFKLICEPAAEEFGFLLKDKVAYYRLINLQKISEKVKRKAEAKKLKFTGEIKPRLLKEILEESSWCEDNIIQEMWAGLILEGSTNPASTDDNLIYVDYLKKLTAFQARLLNKIYSDPRACSVRPPIGFWDEGSYNPENPLIYDVSMIIQLFPGDLATIVPISNVTHEKILQDTSGHSIALGRFKPQIEKLKTLGLINDFQTLPGPRIQIKFIPNEAGLDLYMRGLGISVYPIEAFLLTLQHWNQLKGIDPFKYNPGA